MKKTVHSITISGLIFVNVLITGCISRGKENTDPKPINLWTWVSGSNMENQLGVYGAKGKADPANAPGARDCGVSWIDSSNNLWLFGGGYMSAGKNVFLNDLWKFDGTNWTWVSGSDKNNQAGIYGTQGTADPSNVPGARDGCMSWTDSSNNLWLFGGAGIDSTGSLDRLNDLWKFDGTNWTWVSGSNIAKQAGTYGTKGTADPVNVPGARDGGITWIDSSNNLWLFGGDGYDSAGDLVILNDLWKFDGKKWIWVSGSNKGDQDGIYGTKGKADPSNAPGSRFRSIGWIDSSNNLWLFGGDGYGYNTYWYGSGNLNDLWKFDGSNWTWISGSNTIKQTGIYSTQGTINSSNTPGARMGGISWKDSSNNLWLFGGYGVDSSGNSGFLNDLWRFDGANWTWISGSNTKDQPGTYGTKGTANSSNIPGARNGSISWKDSSNSLWFFGGLDSNYADFNDLWKYQP